MADATTRSTPSKNSSGRRPSHPVGRPQPLRTSSESASVDGRPNSASNGEHNRHRHKSSYLAFRPRQLRLQRQTNNDAKHTKPPAVHIEAPDCQEYVALPALAENGELLPESPHREPPGTSFQEPENESEHLVCSDLMLYDFSRIDYELDRARSIGTGLWSTVFFAQPVLQSTRQTVSKISNPSPTSWKRSNSPPCSLYAVKVAVRPDAKAIFEQEARILTTLQRSEDSGSFLVPFYGLDGRHSALVFEGVVGGSLESLVTRLKTMTELERHLELQDDALFFRLACDLIDGLRFIHASGIIHADIKPANILLDISDQASGDRPVIRARYIDFSASFVDGSDSITNAGGTWDYMAPEQMRIQKHLNTPTFASDVWSLGISLLFILVGGSPYAAACGSNMFQLREGIKNGDPISYAKVDPVIQKRFTSCQDFVDVSKVALQKDRDRRLTAAAWLESSAMRALHEKNQIYTI